MLRISKVRETGKEIGTTNRNRAKNSYSVFKAALIKTRETQVNLCCRWNRSIPGAISNWNIPETDQEGHAEAELERARDVHEIVLQI